MSNEPCARSAATARPSGVRAATLGAALPVMLVVGAVFAAPFAAVVPVGRIGGSSGANLADRCDSPAAQATSASDVAFGASAAKWPLCAGD